ncbi:DUF7224 domain-containing protein [Streptomyces tagetis]|uniref:DUF7224 domain-containing protein n=1 Tax=Streptomyces tagetis TaxID=2820809 RepID=A0A941B7U4_9ACTN|nr:hypothetical protein [Streptomyces sp. RG38]MBQ0827818.1 hypothetical protein [Streptomyces sp. RG38]
MFRFHPRAHSAVLAAPPLLGIVLLYVFSAEVSGNLDGYWTSATAKAASTLMFIAPVTAACAAWEAGRLRSARIGNRTPTRNGWRIGAAALVPVMALGFVALGVSLAGVRMQMESPGGWPDLPILASAAVVLVAHTLAGYAVGMWLPAVAAVPVVLVGDYLWNVYPPALEPVWLRHLTGPAFGCCMNAAVADPASIVGPALLAAGLAALAVGAVAASPHAPRLGALPGPAAYAGGAVALLTTVATTTGSVALVDGLGPDAVRARPASDLVCADAEGTRVCVWPEHRARLAETTGIVTTAVAGLSRVGITAPDVVTEDGRRTSAKRWTVTVRQDPGFTGQDIRSGLVSDLSRLLVDTAEGADPGNCPADQAVAVQRALEAEDGLRVWLSAHAGASEEEARHRVDPSVGESVAPVLADGVETQKDWYRSALARARCMPR